MSVFYEVKRNTRTPEFQDEMEFISMVARMKAGIKHGYTAAQSVSYDIEYAHPIKPMPFGWVVLFQHDSPWAVY